VTIYISKRSIGTTDMGSILLHFMPRQLVFAG
jgi:hypothetical protein